MSETGKRDVCALDYLLGTLATAYKGAITSLVAKDFCMSYETSEVVLKGGILALPSGDFEVVLIASGVELARGRITEGAFLLSAPAREVEAAENLQIDVVDRGRHIGTFLLKRDKGLGYFSSALELSQELEGVNLSALNEALGNKPGLRERGEEIVAAILSTKKDWRRLSDAMNRFGGDLFWYNREVFRMWYPVLARFLGIAAERAPGRERGKTVGNLLRLLLLPLGEEDDQERIRDFASIWLEEIDTRDVPYALRRKACPALVTAIFGLVQRERAEAFARRVSASFRHRISGTATIPEPLFRLLGEIAGEGDAGRCRVWSGRHVETLLSRLQREETNLESSSGPDGLVDALDGVEESLFDGVSLVRTIVEMVRGRLEKALPAVRDAFIDGFISLGGRLDEDGTRALVLGAVRIFKGFMDAREEAGAGVFLEALRNAGPERDRILLSAEMVSAVLGSGDDALIARFDELLAGVHLPGPGISGFSEETWAELAEPAHLERLGTLLDIVAAGGGRLPRTILFLVARLHVVGAFVPDDRLFQRKVSAILNSEGPARDYLLHYLLLKRLPVFFNEVGASGRIRDLSTELDAAGDDPVLYFLRKQVHVNASARNVALVEAVMNAWAEGDRELLDGMVPGEILTQADAGLFERLSGILAELFETIREEEGPGSRRRSEVILAAAPERLRNALERAAGDPALKGRIELLAGLHRELVVKYGGGGRGAEGEAGTLGESLAAGARRLDELMRVCLDPAVTQADESFYFKRHIAFGIPSVIGSYRERKFDAFREALAVEEGLRVLLERYVEEIGEHGTRDDDAPVPEIFAEWVRVLEVTMELFTFHGLGNHHVKEIVTVLEHNSLRCSQVVDLLRLWQRELTWTVEVLYRRFHGPLGVIIPSYSPREFPPRLAALDRNAPGFADKAADVIIRDLVHAVLGLEEADRLLNAMVKALERWIASGGDVTIGGGRFSEQRPEGLRSLDQLSAADAVREGPLLGAKAMNLVRLREAGLRVPSGVVLTAGCCTAAGGPGTPDGFAEMVREGIRILEKTSGRRLGDPDAPLLLSVRSGSYISMPGILETVLFCGINRRIAERMRDVSGDPWAPWDSYRRFLEHYGVVVLGLDHEDFLGVLARAVEREGVGTVEELAPRPMMDLVRRYEDIVSRAGGVPEDPGEQIVESARAICRSWVGPRARAFREAMSVSSAWGTSVTLMEMIPGNAPDAGASVFFTRVPTTLEPGVYGETRSRGSGDDLVYGKSNNLPIAAVQSPEGESLERRDPELFRLHAETAARVEGALGGLPQEVEAVYAGKTMFVLQTKRMEFAGALTDRFHEICRMESSIVGRGVGVHGGALSGVVTFAGSPDAIRKLRAGGAEAVILLRRETSTDDVALMPEVDAILTSLGGATSHAAILAQKFGLTAVVGCTEMRIWREAGEPSATIGSHRVSEGDALSMDGSTGLVYSGVCEFTVRSRREEGTV